MLLLFAFRSALMVRFGLLINDTPTINVSFVGLALNIGYVCFFFCYTNTVKDKTLAWAQIGYGGAFTAAVLAYSFVENPKDLPFRFGIILTVTLFYFVGSPLLGLVRFFLLNGRQLRSSTFLIIYFDIFREKLSVKRAPKDFHFQSF